MKKCTICKKLKDFAEFNKKSARKDGLQSQCRQCAKDKSKEYYQKNTTNHRIVTRQRTIRIRNEIRDYLYQVKSEKGCCRCDEREVCCIDFHHLRDKSFDLANACRVGVSLEKVKQEIDKCICVCSNCHRKIHEGLIVVS